MGEHEFVLKEVRTNPTRVVLLMPSENWFGPEVYIADEEGNRTARMGRRTRTNGRDQAVEFEYALEPNRIWKISATFVAASSGALMGVRGLTESRFVGADRYLVGGDTDVVILQDYVKFQRFLVSLTAGGETWLTNASGTKFRCRFDGKMVSFGKPGAREIPYFVVLSATNGAGQRIERELGAVAGGALSWRSDGSERVQVWSPRRPCTNLVLDLALPEVVTTEFYVRPDAVAGP